MAISGLALLLLNLRLCTGSGGPVTSGDPENPRSSEVGLSKNPSSDAKVCIAPSESLFLMASPLSLTSDVVQTVFSKKSSGNSDNGVGTLIGPITSSKNYMHRTIGTNESSEGLPPGKVEPLRVKPLKLLVSPGPQQKLAPR
ncbi:Uncharacterized protein Fot_07700 [Forsythia ovata]|uniref:Uncharacterized protein n=1 Tax=Forsythia ovata TaxID=205694 RepID=A0ABD1WWK2_9LAMI